MRKEPFTVGDYIHIYNRGNRKMPIVYDEADRWRFTKSLRFLNEELGVEALFKKLNTFPKAAFGKRAKRVFDFRFPISWPDHKPVVKILCFFLAPNHFHLLLKEIQKGGITKFMEKIGTGFTNYINLRYKETGRLFQGPYKGRTVNRMQYLQYLNVYIQVLNPFEVYPGGLKKAVEEFDKAFEFAVNYQFGSLPDFLGKRNLGIIEKDIFEGMFPDVKSYKEFAYDCLIGKNLRKILGKLIID